jgi:hypothetical protein
MKFEIDIHDEFVDRIVSAWLKDSIAMIDNWQGYIHPDDEEYNAELLPALIRVLEYVGEDYEELSND